MQRAAFFRGMAATAIVALSAGCSAVRPGDLAPVFTLRSAAGSEVSLTSFEGQVVVLNYWASW